MQEFHLDKKFVIYFRFSFAICVGSLLFGLLLPFLPVGAEQDQNEVIKATIFFILLGGFSAAFLWSAMSKFPNMRVVADDDGIWYKHLGKEQGLIVWGRISKIKERAFLQRLDLLDNNDRRLLCVEYQMKDLEHLRRIILANICLEGPEFKRSRFSKGIVYHLFYVSGILGFSALAIYVAVTWATLLGMVLIAFILYEYQATATGIEIKSESFIISYPAAKRKIPFSEVVDIQLTDAYSKGSRFPEVSIISKTYKKPIRLKQLDVASSVLFTILRKTIQR